jgi:hypothetical protein
LGFHVDFALANWYSSSFLELGAILWSFRSYHFLLFLLFHFFFRINFDRRVSRKPYSGSFWNLTQK